MPTRSNVIMLPTRLHSSAAAFPIISSSLFLVVFEPPIDKLFSSLKLISSKINRNFYQSLVPSL